MQQKDREHEWYDVTMNNPQMNMVGTGEMRFPNRMFHCNNCGCIRTEKQYTQTQYHELGSEKFTTIPPDCNK